MDDMTESQREEFVKSRVKGILDNHEEFCSTLSSMTNGQRDDFVHRRIELDLAVEFSILQQVNSYVEFRRWVWRAIVLIDVVALLGMISIALRDWQDIVSFVGVAIAMTASRVVNFVLERRALHIQNMLYKHLSHSGNTAALDYLVDGARGIRTHDNHPG